MNLNSKKRVTVKLKCPNPLFEQWLTEWREEAIAKESKMQYTFNHALTSLRKYPLPLERGADCKILKGFGNTLCKMLDEKLHSYKDTKKSPVLLTRNNQSIHPGVVQSVSAQVSKQYVPKPGSGAFAILVTLYKESAKADFKGFLTKPEIIQLAKYISTVSFTKPDPGTRYTAWSSMKTLLEKKLVSKVKHKPPSFSLTGDGMETAKLCMASNGIPQTPVDDSEECLKRRDISNKRKSEEMCDLVEEISPNPEDKRNDLIKVRSNVPKISTAIPLTVPSLQGPVDTKKIKKTIAKSVSSCSIDTETFTIRPHSFDIILYVDNSETSGSSNREDDVILIELNKRNVRYEVKSLKIGDFAWICRDRISGNELVLPYIVERKRMDDFAHSIRDKRYHEQKCRLKKSGIENLIYLIENYGKNQHVGLPLQSLYQAATNTAIQDGFFIKFTENIRETAEYLSRFSKYLITTYKAKLLTNCLKGDILPIDINSDCIALMTFKEFNATSVKNKKVNVTDSFVNMLLQIKGLSVEKALAITEKYSTPSALIQAYENKTETEGAELLANIKLGATKKALGSILSKVVYQAFNKTQY